MTYFRKRKRRSKRSLKKTIILYGVLTIVNLLIMGTLSFFAWMANDYTEKKINDAMVGQAERFFGRKLTDSDRDRIEKKFGIKITPSAGGGDKGPSRGGDFSSAADNANDKGIKDKDLADKIEMYSHGKANPADIEKVKKALRER